MLISKLNLIEFIQKRYHKTSNLSLSFLSKTEVSKKTRELKTESVFLFYTSFNIKLVKWFFFAK